jgi:hypothetical protein
VLSSVTGRIFGAIGIVVAIISIVFAAAIGGAGHGWVTPFFISIPTALFFPLAFFRLGAWRYTGVGGNSGMVVISALAIVMLVIMTGNEGLQYFHAVGWAAWIWIAIWSSWIFAALATAILRHFRSETLEL